MAANDNTPPLTSTDDDSLDLDFNLPEIPTDLGDTDDFFTADESAADSLSFDFDGVDALPEIQEIDDDAYIDVVETDEIEPSADDETVTLTPDELFDIVGSELSEEPTPELSGSELSEEPTPELSGSELGEEPTPELSGSELGEEPTPELSGSELSEEPTPETTSSELGEEPMFDLSGEPDIELGIEPASDLTIDNDLASSDFDISTELELPDFEPPSDLADDFAVDLGDDEEISINDHELLDNIDLIDEPLAFQSAESKVTDEDTNSLLEFSDDELGNEIVNEDFTLPQLSILDSDEDESITLTADELSNIVSVESTPAPDEPDVSDFSDPFDSPDLSTDFDSTEEVITDEVDTDGIDLHDDLSLTDDDSFFHDGEEGPVALTDHELADILDGTSLEEEPRSEELTDEISKEAGVKPEELKKVIGYLDDLLGQLPDETVREFSRSEYFNLYKKIIEELGVFK